jgi:hypothetical protein
MAVNAVSVELLSTIDSLVTGKNTGNLSDFDIETPDRECPIAMQSNAIIELTSKLGLLETGNFRGAVREFMH